MIEDPIVTVEDLREANLCARGAKRWFEIHGLDFRTFLTEGYPASVIEETNDAFGARVVAVTRARAAAEEGDG